MKPKLLLTKIFQNEAFGSLQRKEGIAKLSEIAELVDYDGDLTGDKADGVIGVIADSALVHREFYDSPDLRIVARWGVGYDKVQLPIANELGVVVTVTPVHMDAVAEYTIAQWMATLKRTHTLNRMSHAGDFTIIRTYEAQGSTFGLYGFGRIGQQVAMRAKPLLGESGRLLVYDVRPDIDEVAARFGAEVARDPHDLFHESDTVSLHVSGDETIVDYTCFQTMKPHASLINPSRGNLVDDNAARRAIDEELITYYVVDDPVNGPREVHRDHPRIICTNHNGGITVESVRRLDTKTFEQVTDAIYGRQPEHVLNTEVLEHERVRAWLS
ncbi:MAG: NAD(P)-dependent oxidoreductase [Candidatus Latescibacterota bacterium]|nr:NAD(P)-dependent oxidoreductase [Candidatus Latescibacterota bacterium]